MRAVGLPVAVDFAAVADIEDQDDGFVTLNAVDNAIIANAQAICGEAGKFDDARGPGVFREDFRLVQDSPLDVLGKFAIGPFGGDGEDDLITGGQVANSRLRVSMEIPRPVLR